MSDAAADEVQLLRWLDLRRERISALEASMAVSVETEPTDRWVPAEDADVWPNEANGEDQLEPVRMVPAAEDPDVPCRDVEEAVAVGQHQPQEEPAGDDRAPEAAPCRKIAAEALNVVAPHPKDDGRRHRL